MSANYTFANYQKVVISLYEEKKTNGSLPLGPLEMTPAKLRDECIRVCQERPDDNDISTLRLFFGPGENIWSYQNIIEDGDIEKFKPLINYLRGSTRSTNTINIELLAWLIDFAPRPYNKWEIESRSNNRENTTDRVETPITSKPQELTPPNQNESEKISDNNEIEESAEKTNYQSETAYTEEKNEHVLDAVKTSNEVNIPKTTFFTPPPKKPWFKRNIKQTALSLMAATTLCGGTYMVAYNGSQGCMYWTGDRYKSVPCQEKVEGATVLALDSAKLLNFRKINVPDTLTISSINNLWYTKITVDSAEFYTGSGFHPLFPEKRLKPVTPYILNKYVLNK
ncbi:Uncharacterised protein [Sphingobacterium spiritivorum]|uniref:Uncharacterized protein n=1 Tax=Sphingobacterium spiritivorum TaxID=258 RepID=A0A380CGX4_SPHSI|nr:hypothetical protein [Sphingobacterium spiritivorum]SUJ19316.1 Uncharacterised protein [Sphingobacterium spiritivorum]